MKREAAAASAAISSGGPAALSPPSTSQQFMRQWRALKADLPARYCYLLLTGSGKIKSFFAAGADGILGDAMLAIDAAFEPSDVAAVVAIVHTLSQTARFSLAVDFLSGPERKAAVNVLDRLKAATAVSKEADEAQAETVGPGDASAADAAGVDSNDADIITKMQALFV